jgi:hypothetical protein
MTCRMLACLFVALLARGVGTGPSPLRAAPALKPAPDTPTDTEFCLKVENLIDGVADLDARRFTVLIKGDRKVEFGVHGSRMTLGNEPRSVGDESPGIYRTECIVLLRLQRERVPPTGELARSIHRLVKVGRDEGGTIDGKIAAPDVRNLKDVVEVTAKAGRHPIGKRVVIARVHGQEFSITVK